MSPAEMFTLPEAVPLLLLVPLAWLVLRTLDRRRFRRLTTVVGSRASSLAGDLSLGQRSTFGIAGKQRPRSSLECLSCVALYCF